MATIIVYARLYAACVASAARAIGRSPWTLLLPMMLFAARFIAATLLMGIPLLGGILLAFAIDALISCYFYFVSELVAGSRVQLSELKKSIGAYFWSVLNVMFVIWLVQFFLGGALRHNPQAPVIQAIVYFAAFVLLNAVPEVLYSRGTYGGLATIQGSIAFIHANWIEWFVPNLLFGAAFYFGVPWIEAMAVPWPLVAILEGALLHVIMVFRGFLFQELDKSSHRQRMYRWRNRETG
jgi:hypothetical protein